jgi:hypothetical protein
MESFQCNNRDELNKKEYEYLRLYKDDIVNKNNGKCINKKEYVKEYRNNNQEKIKEKKKEYYENNKEKKKEYYENNKEKIKEYYKKYYENNKEKIKKYYEKSKNSEEIDINHNTGGGLEILSN